MQDLVRIGVADAAEDMWIGQGALQGVVADGQAARELVERRRHYVHSARIESCEPRLALGHVQGRALLRSGFGQGQAAVVEKECRESPAAIGLLRPIEPVQPPGDHQVQHQPDVVIESDGDALAHAPER